MKRICIYPKDIAAITGKSYRQSLRIYHKIKTYYKKEAHQVITVSELEKFLGINLKQEIDYNIKL